MSTEPAQPTLLPPARLQGLPWCSIPSSTAASSASKHSLQLHLHHGFSMLKQQQQKREKPGFLLQAIQAPSLHVSFFQPIFKQH